MIYKSWIVHCHVWLPEGKPKGWSIAIYTKTCFFLGEAQWSADDFLIAMGIIGTILHERARSWFHEQGAERAERVGNAGCFAETVYSVDHLLINTKWCARWHPSQNSCQTMHLLRVTSILVYLSPWAVTTTWKSGGISPKHCQSIGAHHFNGPNKHLFAVGTGSFHPHLIEMISNFCHGFQPLKDSSPLSPKACLVDFGGSSAAMDIYVLCHEVLSRLGGRSNRSHTQTHRRRHTHTLIPVATTRKRWNIKSNYKTVMKLNRWNIKSY